MLEFISFGILIVAEVTSVTNLRRYVSSKYIVKGHQGGLFSPFMLSLHFGRHLSFAESNQNQIKSNLLKTKGPFGHLHCSKTQM